MNIEDEILDVVDHSDRITGQNTRKNIHLKGLIHRSVHILVFNPDRELYLQKRVLSKDENPGLWDSSAAGHVDSGESYDNAAKRELLEELGLSTSLYPLLKLNACIETAWEHVWVYFCLTEEMPRPAPEEISEGDFFSWNEIFKWIKSRDQDFTTSFLIILNNKNINEKLQNLFSLKFS